MVRGSYPVKVTDELLQDVTRKIVEKFAPEKVILFGSYAWGKPGQDSDVDLLVIIETNERPMKLAAAITRHCRPRFLPLDVVVKTPAEINQRLKAGDSFIQKIIKEGRTLYER
ncbi:MAG TPA: nucleotidyltransferase domain-containing protein [Chloroflexi bacterium]|nr:MAG: nucleotidyltransferase domain-containing protein [Thermoprotei archaeon]HDN80124.1 nucleotidyltransferase domain-containing protein [Chloroflexota bacterium]